MENGPLVYRDHSGKIRAWRKSNQDTPPWEFAFFALFRAPLKRAWKRNLRDFVVRFRIDFAFQAVGVIRI
jgi:hypothetical protein